MDNEIIQELPVKIKTEVDVLLEVLGETVIAHNIENNVILVMNNNRYSSGIINVRKSSQFPDNVEIISYRHIDDMFKITELERKYFGSPDEFISCIAKILK